MAAAETCSSGCLLTLALQVLHGAPSDVARPPDEHSFQAADATSRLRVVALVKALAYRALLLLGQASAQPV